MLTTLGIVFSVVFETLRFFSKVSPIDFLFGLQWSPQTAMREDQVGQSGAFGIVPLIVGTLLITFIAMLVAGPSACSRRSTWPSMRRHESAPWPSQCWKF